MLNNEITRQASTIAYIDDFERMPILALCSLPLVVLIRPARARVAGGDHAAVMD